MSRELVEQSEDHNREEHDVGTHASTGPTQHVVHIAHDLVYQGLGSVEAPFQLLEHRLLILKLGAQVLGEIAHLHNLVRNYVDFLLVHLPHFGLYKMVCFFVDYSVIFFVVGLVLFFH